jgi:hypothetical protein
MEGWQVSDFSANASKTGHSDPLRSACAPSNVDDGIARFLLRDQAIVQLAQPHGKSHQMDQMLALDVGSS